MNPQWVELVAKHPKHGDVGHKFEAAEAVAKSLIEDGFAKTCDAPNPEVTKEAQTILDGLNKHIDAKIEKGFASLKEEAKSLNTAITKSFGLLAPAQAKDHAVEDRGGFESMGHYFTSIVKSAQPGAVIDDRLQKMQTKAIEGMGTTVGADGGYLVPAEFSNKVMEMAFRDAPFSSRCDTVTISGGSLTLNAVDENDRATGSRRGGVRGYWLEEGDAFTKSKPKFRQMTLKPHKLGVFYYATEEELTDAAFGYNIEAKLAQYAGEEIRWLVNEAIFAGNGVNKPLGILNAPGTVSVAKEGSQTATTINFPNIYKMYMRMHPDSLTRARWYMNQDCLSQLFTLKWPDASGTYPIYVSGSQYPNAAEAPFGTLFGRPIDITEHNETLGTVGDIVFADFSQYALGVKGGLKSAFSMHVAFTSEQNCWRFSYRVDGQPYANKPLTPAKGTSNTLSHFVTLATRA